MEDELSLCMVYVLGPQSSDPFPPVELAATYPDGLLAAGGDLSMERLLNAYQSGIFPWYGPGEPILWWSPDPRMILLPENLHISRSMRKTLRHTDFEFRLDCDFGGVIRACAAPRRDEAGTWIVADMIQAYEDLHRAGWAHSAEVWLDNQLVGGLYGIAMGQVFFGESMFSKITDGSKLAFICFVQFLKEQGFELIDCQVYTAHLESLGAGLIERSEFIELLCRYCRRQDSAGLWSDHNAAHLAKQFKSPRPQLPES